MPSIDDRILGDLSEEKRCLSSIRGLLLLSIALVLIVIPAYLVFTNSDLKELFLSEKQIADPLSVSLEDFLNSTCQNNNPDYISECRRLHQRFCNRSAVEKAMHQFEKRDNFAASAKIGEEFLARCNVDSRMGIFTT